MRKLVAVLLALLVAVPAFSKRQNDFVIKRGINLSHWLSQGYARGRMREQRVTEADFRLLKEAGFDHVRIPIDEEQFWDEQGNRLPEAWSLLTRSLDLCVKYELRAIVDLHIIRSHYFNAVNEGSPMPTPCFRTRLHSSVWLKCGMNCPIHSSASRTTGWHTNS